MSKNWNQLESSILQFLIHPIYIKKHERGKKGGKSKDYLLGENEEGL